MKLDDNYSIITTKECVELKFEEPFYNEEKGKDSVRTQVLYFPNMKMALKKYVNNKVDNCQNIERIVDMINYLEHKIDNLKL